MGYSLWYVKIDPSQNQDQSTSLERSYKELLNAIKSVTTLTLLYYPYYIILLLLLDISQYAF